MYMLITFIALGVTIGIWFSIRPSNERNWSLDQKILSYAEITGTRAKIYNIRNFTYASTTSYTPAYYDSIFDLNTISSLEYVYEPFSSWAGSAHTFLTFGFEDKKYVSISIEIRKEQGETFSAVKGLFKQFEIMYVIADERDVIKLRSNYRKDNVYLFPLAIPKEQIRQIFVDMLTKANELKVHPEFYNTLTNTCATNIVKHISARFPLPFSEFNYKIICPGYSDKLLYDHKLIAKAAFHINERALEYADDPDFSQKIRNR
jgi:hypothetical protein